jgi:cbb3-type cytochrome c oxidase subunit III
MKDTLPRMKKLKMTAALLSVAFVAAAAALAQAPAGADVKKGQVNEKGKSVYAANCARCHGADGQGQTTIGRMTEAPDMTDPKWQAGRSRSRMVASVTQGRGQMPAFSKKLSKEEIAAAVAYVRSFKR